MSGFFDSPLPAESGPLVYDARRSLPTLASLLPPTPPRFRRL